MRLKVLRYRGGSFTLDVSSPRELLDFFMEEPNRILYSVRVMDGAKIGPWVGFIIGGRSDDELDESCGFIFEQATRLLERSS